MTDSMSELTCPHPDCGEPVLLDWHLAYAIVLGDLPVSSNTQNDHGRPVAPTDAHATSWTVGCMGGHVLLTPGPVGCGCAEYDCGHDPESYDWAEEDRRFRAHDWHRLRQVLIALAATRPPKMHK